MHRLLAAGIRVLTAGLLLFSLALPATLSAQSSGPCDLPGVDQAADTAERELLAAINRYREEQGLTPVQFSPVLLRVARWKALTLAGGGIRPISFDDHNDSFRTWEQRFLDCGYPDSAQFAESFADGNAPWDMILDGWKGSPVHNGILTNPDWRYAGLARAVAGTRDGMPYYVWVLDVGTEPG
jgi:uncharacterized protein YkwD